MLYTHSGQWPNICKLQRQIQAEFLKSFSKQFGKDSVKIGVGRLEQISCINLHSTMYLLIFYIFLRNDETVIWPRCIRTSDTHNTFIVLHGSNSPSK